MGGCCSSPATSDNKTSADKKGEAVKKVPDFGLGDAYTLVEKIGRGGTGETWLCTRKATGEQVAVKIIRRPIPPILMKQILREITIQADLGEGHVNIIKAIEVVLTPTHLALVLEYAARGSLTKYVSARWPHAQQHGLFLTEDEARYIFKQFISAVEYCHEHKVAHRDLKLDNTLLDDSNPPLIKLCDFGFANAFQGEEANMSTHLGTPAYMSPELLGQKDNSQGYDAKSVDIWASGVTLIVMLMGAFPFDHAEGLDPNSPQAQYEVWMAQVGGRWSEFPHVQPSMKKLTPDCVDLLNGIFEVDSKKRITIEQIKQHPWYLAELTPPFKAAEEARAVEQAQLDAARERFHTNPSLVSTRNKQLQDLVDKAGTKKDGETGCVRVDLQEKAVLDRLSIMEPVSMAEEEPAAEDGKPPNAI